MKKFSTLLAGALALGTLTASADPMLYINNQCGYEATAVYMRGDINDLFVAGPGYPLSGTATVNNITFLKRLLQDILTCRVYPLKIQQKETST